MPPAVTGFPVVGIGASAGGFPALMALLGNMPADPGMALVVILHLAPDEPSAADRVLQSATALPVMQVTQPTPIQPGWVYVIPPDRSLAMRDGQLVPDALERSGGLPAAIDIFLCTLAKAHTEHAIGIVLSGMGSDGTAGLASIKEMGGVTIAQLPDEAEHDSMPRSAIEAGMADFVLAAAAVPHKLAELRDTMRAIRRRAQERDHVVQASAGQDSAAQAGAQDGGASPLALDQGPHPQAALREVFDTLRARTGHDFSHYRRPTLLRRLERRLQVRAVADLPAYIGLLRDDPAEPAALVKDLLIGVTGFFRDRAAFDAMRREVLPSLFHAGHDGHPLRAWVAACSTGEEAYTLAMLLADHAEAEGGRRAVQLFASDIDEHAIGVARAGLYPASIAAQVPPAQLERHFTHAGQQYKVRQDLRERILFTRHDLLRDPTFSRLDLISCRNFLIYLNADMHRQLLQQFHFALNPGGYLLLGSAESAEPAADLFVAVSPEHRIYRARPGPRRPGPLPAGATAGPAFLPDAGPAPLRHGPDLASTSDSVRRGRLFSFADIHQQRAAELGPPSILVNADSDIVHVAERAARFLRQAGGEPTLELAALVLAPLQLPLRAALLQARRSGAPSRTGPVSFGHDGATRVVDMAVAPFRDPHAEGQLMLVQFVETPDTAAAHGAALSPHDGALLRQLDQELRHTRRQLHDTMDGAQTARNEMRVVGEEMQTTIEQLRAALAELERERNALQRANQGLTQDNLALQRRAEQSAKAHDDLSNLIASSGVATIFLDRSMRIVRYTPRIADFFNVIPGDVGRPLQDITNRLDYPQLAGDAARVFDTLQAMEGEVRGRDGRDYIVRVVPYRTTTDRIDGAVMTFFDISNRRAEEAVRRSEERFRLLVTAISDTLYKMNADWSEMRSLQGMRFLADTDHPSQSWLEKYIPVEDQARVKAAIAKAIRNKAIFELEHRVISNDGGIAWTLSRAIPLLDAQGNIVEWFGAATDITERKLGK